MGVVRFSARPAVTLFVAAMFKLVISLCLISVALAQYHGHGDHKDVDYYAAPHYKFEYGVHDPHTHDFKKVEEERKDDHTKGSYSVKDKHGHTSRHYLVHGVQKKHV